MMLAVAETPFTRLLKKKGEMFPCNRDYIPEILSEFLLIFAIIRVTKSLFKYYLIFNSGQPSVFSQLFYLYIFRLCLKLLKLVQKHRIHIMQLY